MMSAAFRLCAPAPHRHGRDYLELTKPRVVALITFTAMVGMLLATPGMVPWEILLFGSTRHRADGRVRRRHQPSGGP
jgi:protoheme IX farnesyltransferase